ncbi:MAG: hypothetical protein HOL15_07235 [Nitrospinaceae bacterium]|nr:hypothetical protein [Nitrospinaceae bacterium]
MIVYPEVCFNEPLTIHVWLKSKVPHIHRFRLGACNEPEIPKLTTELIQ